MQPSLKSAIHTRFPSLKALDGHILGPLPDQGANAASARPAVGSALRQPAAFPKGVAPGFFGEPESRDVATAFLTKCVPSVCPSDHVTSSDMGFQPVTDSSLYTIPTDKLLLRLILRMPPSRCPSLLQFLIGPGRQRRCKTYHASIP